LIISGFGIPLLGGAASPPPIRNPKSAIRISIVPTARTLRLNELLHRELSALLHSEHQAESVAITIGGVDVAPDLTGCRVFVAVTGDDEMTEDRLRWLRRMAGRFRAELSRRIVLKHLPALTFELDVATSRGNRILAVLDEITAKAPPASPSAADTAEGNAPAEDAGKLSSLAAAAVQTQPRFQRRRHAADSEKTAPPARRVPTRRDDSA
jgi:ribosome-binding factor A